MERERPLTHLAFIDFVKQSTAVNSSQHQGRVCWVAKHHLSATAVAVSVNNNEYTRWTGHPPMETRN